MKTNVVVFMGSLLLLSACSAPDTEGMKQGLLSNGMTPSQAACYANNLKGIIGVDEYNNLAELMLNGADKAEAIKKTRRKFGAEFKTAMTANSDSLDSCLN